MHRLLFAACSIVLATAYAEAQTALTNWTGFYAGVSVGARAIDSTWTSTNVAPTLVAQGILSVDPNNSAPFDSSAARFGGYLGYNWHVAPQWVAGIEADFGYANAKESRTPIPGTIQQNIFIVVFPYDSQPMGTVSTAWDGSVRGRFGYLVQPDTMLFATPGIAFQQIDVAGRCSVAGGFTTWCTRLHNESHSHTRIGWTLGGGIEHAIGRWLIRAEYRYADFGTLRQNFFTMDPTVPFDDRLTANVRLQTHTANVGVAYRFGVH